MTMPTDEPDGDIGELLQIGLIHSVDLQAATCTVEIDGEESAPLPWLEASMGKLRIWSPPAVGEQVVVLAMEGEIGSGIVLRGLPSDRYPVAGSGEEFAMIWEDGTRIAYDPETKKLTATLASGGKVELTAEDVAITGNTQITGNLDITGDLNVGGTITDGSLSTYDGIAARRHT